MSRTTLPTTERRGLSLTDAGVSLRAAEVGENGPPTFVGYAAKFNDRTAIGNPLSWGFYEQVASGAFTKTLDEGDARFLVDHDTAQPVARVSAGTLRLSQDATGLAVDADLNTRKSYVANLFENLTDGTVTGMSFGFEVLKDEWEMIDVETKDGDTVQAELRTLREVKLWEVSAVTFPAYDSTEASLRSVATALISRGDSDAIERHARLKPELYRYTQIGEPADATRSDVEPAVSTLTVADKMKALAARYSLPLVG